MNQKFQLKDRVTIKVIKKQNIDQKKINNSLQQNKVENKKDEI